MTTTNMLANLEADRGHDELRTQNPGVGLRSEE